MNNCIKLLIIAFILITMTQIAQAGKCQGTKVNDCSTFTDALNDRSTVCKKAYKAGALYGGYPCTWISIGNGGECIPTTKTCG